VGLSGQIRVVVYDGKRLRTYTQQRWPQTRAAVESVLSQQPSPRPVRTARPRSPCTARAARGLAYSSQLLAPTTWRSWINTARNNLIHLYQQAARAK
jgi:hypothetical protein